MEWPPSPCVLKVFSSKTGRWEERSFAREGEAVGFVSELRLESSPLRQLWRHAVHLEGTLYVQCRGAYVMRLSLREDTYQVIKTPIGITACAKARTYLGGLQNRVCFAAIEEPRKLSVWVLNELSACRDWVLKHQGDVALSYHHDQVTKEWNLDDDNDANIDLLGDDRSEEEGGFSGSLFYDSGDEKDTTDKEIVEENIEWDSDEDNVVRIRTEGLGYVRNISILGFHPYKEVIFLTNSSIGVAYQLKTSIFRYLGVLRPTSYNPEFADIEVILVYTLHDWRT